MEQEKQKRILRETAVWTGASAALLLLLTTGLSFWAEYKIRRTIETETASRSGGRYKASIGNLKIRLIGRTIILEEFGLQADSSAGFPASGQNSLGIRIGKIKLKGIRLKRQKDSVLVHIREADFTAPSISIVHEGKKVPAQQRQENASVENTGPLTGRIGIGSVNIGQGTVEIRTRKDGEETDHTIRDINVSTENFALDFSEIGRSLARNDIRLTAGRMSRNYDRGAMSLEIDSVFVSTGAKTLRLKGIKSIPRYGKDEFALLAPGHTDWTQFTAMRAEASGIDFEDLVRNRRLTIDSLNLCDATVSSYKNRQIPQKQRIKPLFYRAFQRIGMETTIRSVLITNMDAVYEELPETGSVPGRISFTGLQGRCTGLTNAPDSAGARIRLEATGKLMNAGAISALFLFPADSLDERFEVKGRLGPFDLKALDPILVPLAKTRVDSGRVRSMDFHIQGTDSLSEVRLELLYDGLNVSLVKERDGTIRRRDFLSAVIDGLLIRRSNPQNGTTRTGTGSARRDPYRSQFNYLWKSLLPGIEHTLTQYDSGIKRRERHDRHGRNDTPDRHDK